MKNYTFYMKNHNAYAITPILDDVVRIQYNGTGVFKQSLMERYDIIKTEFADVESKLIDAGDSKTIISGNLRVEIHEDSSFSIFSGDEILLDKVVPFHPQEELGVGGKIAISDKERFYGCGYRPSKSIELRNQVINNWCAPNKNNGPSTFFVSSNGWGLFWNNTCETFFDFANKEKENIIFWCEEGEFDIFIFAGNFKKMIMDFTEITGKPSLMPLNGYGITVVNNESEDEVSLIDKAERLRREKIPCDNFSISCEWMSTYYDKSVNQDFDLKRYNVYGWMKEEHTFIHVLKHFGIKSTLWTPCEYDLTFEQERRYFKKHPEELEKTPMYESVIKQSRMAVIPTDADSKMFTDGAMFHDENLYLVQRHDPYTVPQEAWHQHFKRFYDLGIVGLAEDGHAVQITKIDHFYGNGYSYKHMHNLNQTLNSLQYYEGFKEYKNQRIFVRTPSTFIGHQKYCGTWCGDSGSDTSLVGLLQYSFQGQSNVTADMVSRDPKQIHAGMFMPWVLNFCWASHVWPWFLPEKVRNIYVDYARLRYALMPYVYTAAYNAHITGLSVCTAMIINYPDDERFYNEYHQYMYGDSILVGVLSDEIHLPEGEWVDYWTKKEYKGKMTVTEGYPEDKGGYFFIKKGAILPLWEDVQYVGEKPIDVMTIQIFPNDEGEYTLYEDDGISYGFDEGVYALTKFSYRCENNQMTVCIETKKDTYRIPENRDYHIEIYMEKPETIAENMMYDDEKKALCFTMHQDETVVIG